MTMANTQGDSPMTVYIGDGVELKASPAPTQAQQKRNNRNKKHRSQPNGHLDGSVSDSVTGTTGPAASPRSKKGQNNRRQQSVAVPHVHSQTDLTTDGHVKPRPVSLGGPLLPSTPGPKPPAYAGPTFSASPAPSSLPVPKFFSRSVPNGAGKPSLQARLETDKSPQKEKASPESDTAEPVEPAPPQSPLDLFFQADRLEKEKARNSNSLSPDMALRKPPSTEPRNLSHRSGKNIFLGELDGDHADMPSPRTIPPNFQPAPERAHSSPPFALPTQSDEAQSESLKRLLFQTAATPPPYHATPPQTQQPRAQSDAHIFNTPSPFQRSASGPSTPAAATDASTQHYALAYGQRTNLSPLFKAARNETPTRPSGLRQELPNHFHDPSPPAAQQQQQLLPRQLRQLDPTSFSRDYLDQQIRSHPSASLPQLPFMNGGGAGPPVGNSPGPSTASFSGPSGGFSQQGVMAGGMGGRTNNTASDSPRTGGAKDISVMEEKLKNMLKLNVLS
jgi:hypothetical protein